VTSYPGTGEVETLEEAESIPVEDFLSTDDISLKPQMQRHFKDTKAFLNKKAYFSELIQLYDILCKDYVRTR